MQSTDGCSACVARRTATGKDALWRGTAESVYVATRKKYERDKRKKGGKNKVHRGEKRNVNEQGVSVAVEKIGDVRNIQRGIRNK